MSQQYCREPDQVSREAFERAQIKRIVPSDSPGKERKGKES